MMPYDGLQYKRDIDLYIDSMYSGFMTIETIEEYLDEYIQLAEEKAKTVEWDHVILYAIFEYDAPEQSILSANFMLLVIPYGMYADFALKLRESTRLFFIRGRKECYDE